MFSTLITFAIASVLAVNAQSSSGTASAAVPTGTPAIPPCVLTCTSQAAANTTGCKGTQDIACVCTNTQFQQAATACLQASCSQDDQTAANAIQSGLCSGASASGSVSGSSTAPASGTATGSVTDTSTNTATGNSTASATAPGGSASSGVSSLSSAASGALSSLSSAASGAASSATSPASTSNAAAVLTPFGFIPAHAVGVAGVLLAMVAGGAALF